MAMTGNMIQYRKARVRELLDGCTPQQVMDILRYAGQWDALYDTVSSSVASALSTGVPTDVDRAVLSLRDLAEEKLRDGILRGDGLLIKFAAERAERLSSVSQEGDITINIVPYDVEDAITVDRTTYKVTGRKRGRRVG